MLSAQSSKPEGNSDSASVSSRSGSSDDDDDDDDDDDKGSGTGVGSAESICCISASLISLSKARCSRESRIFSLLRHLIK